LTYGYGHVNFGSSKDKALARKILLADDSVTAQNMGRKILTDAGYEVVTVNNGSAALKKVAEAQPELIVLDVYMPGYSGLEVCQRIKDSRETSHIPVLLTVGKLEPFKQDEARRVRADAFIIKPFEASELMAAVAKLESKLGTAPAPRKEGRHSGPATMENFERTAAASGPQYGDEESGRKARLKFPSSERKQSEPEPESEPDALKPTSGGAFRELISEKPAASSFGPTMPDRPIPAGLPQDITPEEIAAIAAAAARVKGGISVGENFERLTDESPGSTQPEQKTPVAPAEETKTETAAVSAPIQATAALSASPLPAEIATEPTSKTSSKPKPHEAASSATPEKPVSLQAVSQTAPTTLSIGEGSQTSEPVSAAPAGSSDSEPVTVAAIGPAPEIASVPAAAAAVSFRWMAEEIPVHASESALVLEREMHKAYAAFAAADHGQTYESAPIDRDDEPMFATMAPPAIGAPLPMMEAAAEPNNSKDRDTTEELSRTTAAVSTESHEMPSAKVSKPPAPPFAPAGPSDSGHSVVAFGGPDLMGGPEPSGLIDAAHTKSAETSSFQSTPALVVSESKATGEDEKSPAKREPDADLTTSTAAAWANWREVRESVLGSKSTPETAQAGNEPPSADLEDLKKIKGLKKGDPVPSPEPEAAKAAAASADSSASSDPNLSSIVDNMLAELKPKLMAELAEKLKKEKNKK
jgi:twitching motility two-component system response regulator PilH